MLLDLKTTTKKVLGAVAFENIDRLRLYKTLVIIASVSLILWGCFLILRPFIPAFALALIFTLSAWPAFTWLRDKLNGLSMIAASIMTLGLALCFLLPIAFLGNSLADNFARLYVGVIAPALNSPTEMPEWLSDVPLIGDYIEDIWNEYLMGTLGNGEAVRAYLAPKVITIGTAIGKGLADIALGIVFAFFFFSHGVTAAARVNSLLTRFAGPKGLHLLDISKRTVIGVVYGILGTSVAQGVLAAAGFWIAGVPGATFLGIVTMLLSFVPAGPPLIWIPATIWLFLNGEISYGIFMAIWGTFVISGVDNVIRPYFISLGSSLPLLLVILGVFGGVLAFGFIGLFIGPTLLALAYSLITEWSRTDSDFRELDDAIADEADAR